MNAKRIFNRLIEGFSKHDLLTLAAALSFYTALSLAPLLLLMVASLGAMDPKAVQDLMVQIDQLMGPQAAEAIKMITENAAAHPIGSHFAGIVGVVTLLFSASGVFSQLQSSLNVIWEAPPTAQQSGFGGYLRGKLFSMGIVLAFVFIAIISLAVSTALAAILPSGANWWSVLNNGVSIAAFAYLFALVFKYLPAQPNRWRDVLMGGLVTSALFTLGKSLIGLYLGKSAVGSAYGAAGSLIVLLTWVYYSSIILFLGAEITRAFFRESQSGRRS